MGRHDTVLNSRGSILPTVLIILVVGAISSVLVLEQSSTLTRVAGNSYRSAVASEGASSDLLLAKVKAYAAAGTILKTAAGENFTTEPLSILNTITIPGGSIAFTKPPSFRGQANGAGGLYAYLYTLSVTSEIANGLGSRTVKSEGIMSVTVPTGGNFGDFFQFYDRVSFPPLGSPLSRRSASNAAAPLIFDAGQWEGDTISGKFHTNGAAYSDSHGVGLAGQPSFWWFKSRHDGGPKDGDHYQDPITSAVDKYHHMTIDQTSGNAQTDREEAISAIVPSAPYWVPSNASFSHIKAEGGISVASTVPMPTNSYYQESAAVTGTASTTALSNEDKRAALGLAVNSSPPPDDIYVPNTGSGGNVTGGVYIQGCVNSIWPERNGLTNSQEYWITLCNGKNVDVKVNYTTNTTTLTKPDPNDLIPPIATISAAYSGVTNGAIYTTGEIKALRSGNLATQYALHEKTKVTITAGSGDIAINGSLRYKENPLTVGPAQNMLGVYAANGNVAFCKTTTCSAGINFQWDGYYMSANGTVGINWNKGLPGGVNKLGNCQGVGSTISTFVGEWNNPAGANWNGCEWLFRGKDLRSDRPPFFPTYSSGTAAPVDILDVGQVATAN